MAGRALFITYDGLLDPLGGSQILPYLRAIAPDLEGLWVLSFEKPDRLAAGRADLSRTLAAHDIHWVPLRFTAGGTLSKIWDLLRLHLFVLLVALLHRVHIVHARGHQAAQAGAWAKRLIGARLLFDVRGLWADERLDKGGWTLTRRSHALQYRHYKRVEGALLRKADAIVALTDAVVPELVRLGAPDAEAITVIPCCADFDHFGLPDAAARATARQACGMAEAGLVLGYVGSVGRMYQIDRVCALFGFAAATDPAIGFVVLTPDPGAFLREARAHLSEAIVARIACRAASRAEMPRLLPAIDILVSFVMPSYARVATSPTRLAEAFATGIPAVCNYGTGDVAAILARIDGGAMVDAGSDGQLRAIAEDLPAIHARGGARLREAARPLLGLEVAADRYRRLYRRLLGRC